MTESSELDYSTSVTPTSSSAHGGRPRGQDEAGSERGPCARWPPPSPPAPPSTVRAEAGVTAQIRSRCSGLNTPRGLLTAVLPQTFCFHGPPCSLGFSHAPFSPLHSQCPFLRPLKLPLRLSPTSCHLSGGSLTISSLGRPSLDTS